MIDRDSPAERTSVLHSFILGILATAGCIPTHWQGSHGVELEARAVGWKERNHAARTGIPGTFSWEGDGIHVDFEIAGTDPLYFMLYVRNDSTESGRLRVRRDPTVDAPETIGDFDNWGPRRPERPGDYPRDIEINPPPVDDPSLGPMYAPDRGSGTLRIDRWVTLYDRGIVEVWVERIPWCRHPQRGDRIGYVLEVERKGKITTCPLAFRVVQVYLTPGFRSGD